MPAAHGPYFRTYADETKTLTFKLIPKIDDALKADVIKWSAFYEHRIRLGSVSHIGNPLFFFQSILIGKKHIFHLEGFVAKFMRILER